MAKRNRTREERGRQRWDDEEILAEGKKG